MMQSAGMPVRIAPKTKRMTKKNRNKTLFLVCMMALPFIQWLIFWLYVNVSSIMLAFQSQRTGEWTLSNFVTFWNSLTSPTGEIRIAILNTLVYFCTTLFIITPLSFCIAYFIYKRIFMYKVFRIIFYLPAIISAVAMVAAYTNFIDPKGPLGSIVKLFGGTLPPEGLLGKVGTATPTIVFYTVWTGFSTNVLLFGGAMTRIPVELIESARLDGSTALKELIFIILPLIWSTMSTMIVVTFTSIFNSTGPILLFTNGDFETTTLSFWIFKQVYGTGAVGGSGSYNLVSCTGLCFTVVGVPVILFVRWLLERVPAVEY